MRNIILAAALLPALASPALACSSYGYQWGSDGNLVQVCSNQLGYAGAGGGSATPVPNRSQSYGGGNTGWVWDSPGVTNALGAFSGIAAATGNEVASGVFGVMTAVSAMNDAGAFGAFSAGIGPNNAGYGSDTGYGGGL